MENAMNTLPSTINTRSAEFAENSQAMQAQADDLRVAGRAQRTTESVLRASRGTIFARDGGELAISVPTTTIIAITPIVTQPPQIVSYIKAQKSNQPAHPSKPSSTADTTLTIFT